MSADDLTPEHNKRATAPDEKMHPEVHAAYRYVDSVLPTANKDDDDCWTWHGWAMREAFLAGCSHAGAARAANAEADERCVELTYAFPPTLLKVKGDSKTMDALIDQRFFSTCVSESRERTDDDRAERLIERNAELYNKLQQLKQAQSEQEGVAYHWEVRDMNDQWQAGGEAADATSALSRALDASSIYCPCKYRTWTEKTLSSGVVGHAACSPS